MILQRLTLSQKTFLLITLVGLVVWFVSDTIQTKTLSDMFHAKLAERFSLQASEQRVRFDRYVKSYHQGVKLFISTKQLYDYVERNDWSNQPADQIKHYVDVPEWMPSLSVIRKIIQPRYTLLLDSNSRAREVYHFNTPPPPKGLIEPSDILLRLSNNQSYLTLLEGTPYVVTSETLQLKDSRVITLMLASPLDEEFLLDSQGPSAANSTIALLSGEESTILVSSNSDLIPSGTDLASLSDRYLITGEGFFDYGATDILIKFVSFISTEDVTALSSEVLNTDRKIRALTAATFIITFGLIMFWVISRIQRLTQKVVDFSKYMNLNQPDNIAADQLYILEERFEILTEEIRNETEALEYQAQHDPLTGLANRKLLNSSIQNEIHRSNRSKVPMSLLMTDLNHFKEINDTLGHHIGDTVLQHVARRLNSTLRKSDLVARLGGDEFGVLLPETDTDGAIHSARAICKAFEKPFNVEDHNLSVSISIGIVELYKHGSDVNILVQRADVAMYIAKREKTGYQVYDVDKDQYSRDRLEMMTDLRKALENRELELYYQPIADLKQSRIVCVEALLRWHHSERGNIPPDVFVPLAEQTGLMKLLTSFVIDTAIKQCSQWDKQGFSVSMSVNLSVFNLHDANLPSSIARLLSQSEISPERLKLEITETDIMQDPIRAKEILSVLDKMGVMISIDDFGTGYSSLVYLKQLPVDELKIDRSFVSEMLKDESDATIVRATIDLAHNLGLKVVAEGVMDDKTMTMLKDFGCDFAQGYFIQIPLPGNEILHWSKTSSWSAAALTSASNITHIGKQSQSVDK